LECAFRYFPVPDRGTSCGLVGALSVMTRSPVRNPTCVGLKVTFNTQLPPAATGLVVEQDFATVIREKSPLVVIPLMFSVALPELVSVTVFV